MIPGSTVAIVGDRIRKKYTIIRGPFAIKEVANKKEVLPYSLTQSWSYFNRFHEDKNIQREMYDVKPEDGGEITCVSEKRLILISEPDTRDPLYKAYRGEEGTSLLGRRRLHVLARTRSHRRLSFRNRLIAR